MVDEQKNEIRENIYNAEITVWNAGSEDLLPAKIRRPLTFSIPGAESLLGVVLTFTTNDNLGEIALESRDLSRKSFKVTWQHLDPKEGFKLRLSYAAPIPQRITKEFVASGADPTWDSEYVPWWLGWAWLGSFILGPMLATGIVFTMPRRHVIFPILVVLATTVLIVGYWTWAFTRVFEPPF